VRTIFSSCPTVVILPPPREHDCFLRPDCPLGDYAFVRYDLSNRGGAVVLFLSLLTFFFLLGSEVTSCHFHASCLSRRLLPGSLVSRLPASTFPVGPARSCGCLLNLAYSASLHCPRLRVAVVIVMITGQPATFWSTFSPFS